MDPFARAKETANAQIEEIQAIARIQQTFNKLIVGQAGILFPVFNAEPEKSLLKKALRDKGTDASALHRGLLLQLNGVFENFIKTLVSAVVDNKCEAADHYEELDKRMRDEHVVLSAKVLTHLKKGHVFGVRHDFETFQRNLGTCLTNDDKFSLNADAFTLLMGNCTPDRLQNLFDSLGSVCPIFT